MPRFRYKHIQSTIEDKAPQDLLDGEIAVNKYAGKEKLFIKNTEDEIIPFISETQINTKINSAITEVNSEINEINSAITEIYEEMDRRDECKNPKSGTTLYGVSFTNIGMSCDESAITETTTVNGERIIIDAVDGSMGLTATENLIASAEGDVMITADDDLYLSSGEKASFYGASETHIGASLDGVDRSEVIIYERVPGTGQCAITSSTVDDALNEVLDRSKITSNFAADNGFPRMLLRQGYGSCVNETVVPSSPNIYSAVTVSSDMFDVTCPQEIMGVDKTGAQAVVIYENINEGSGGDDPNISPSDPVLNNTQLLGNTKASNGNYTITVANNYKTPLGQQIILVCPVGGYCEVSYLNINGKIYARGGSDYCGSVGPINGGGSSGPIYEGGVA